MANPYTTTKFLADVKRLGHFPANQTTFTNEDILALADNEFQTLVLPELLRVRENYYLRYKDYSGQPSQIEIPDRAIGGKMADIQLITGANIQHVQYLEISQLMSTIGSPIGAYGFTVQDNRVMFWPVPPTGYLRVFYYIRPSRLVETLDCGQITAIDTGTNTVTVSSVPDSFIAGVETDLIQNSNGFSTLQLDNSISGVAGSDITFTDTLPDELSVGDWVALSGESPIPQLPVEIQPLLVQATIVKIYEAQGYLAKMKIASAKMDKMQADLMALITPRVTEAPKVINSPTNGVMDSWWYGYGLFRRY